MRHQPKVLLIDRSGRGHAYADLFTRTNPDVLVYYAPGCASIDNEQIVSIPDCSLNVPDDFLRIAQQVSPDIIFVSNASALVGGLIDKLRSAGHNCLGPTQSASVLEGSKVATKQMCARYGVPVAEFRCFYEWNAAVSYVEQVPHQVVVKADGLCAGKGTFVCNDVDDAKRALQTLMVDHSCGNAGVSVVVEQRLIGQEYSFFALLDGQSAVLLPLALDYKKSDDGNRGVICGGTGAISPHPCESPELTVLFQKQLLEPIRKMILAEGMDYKGVIYLGTMLVGDQFYLLEINVRFGDPEAEVVLPRIESDWYRTCQLILSGSLANESLVLNNSTFVDVVCGQGRTRQISKGKNKGWYEGWPHGRYGKHYPITGVNQIDRSEARVFVGEATLHAVKGLVSDGGRVLHVVGFGPDLATARDNAYRNVQRISFEGCRFRSDIGHLMPWMGEHHEHTSAASFSSI